MDINRILRPGLFAYECIRTILVGFTIAFFLRRPDNAIPWVAFAAPTALFPLITLFICIDINRFRNYLPLYIAGKIIGIAAFLGWSIIWGKFTMIQWVSGDLFALAAALYLTKGDNQCE